MRYSMLIIMLCIVAATNLTHADEIVFKNGDRLTGKIEQLVDGKITFKSVVADTLTIDIETIQTFSTDSPVKVHLSDGTVLDQRIAKASLNKFAIEGDSALKAQPFDLAAISSINPPQKPKPKWTGNLSAGLTSTHGNTQTEAINASMNLSKRMEKDRIQLNADFASGRQKDPDTAVIKTTKNWLRTKAKYDHFFTKKFYGYLDGRYEKDSIANLERRVIIGLGGGYQWVESDDLNFSTELGAASVSEKFTNQTQSNSDVSAQLSYYFDKKLTKTIKFIHNLTYYPSTGSFSDYLITSTAEVRAGISKNMFTNFKIIFDYDTTPALGSSDTDTKYILGVGWSF